MSRTQGVDSTVEGFVDVTRAELLRLRAGVLGSLALLDTKLAEGLESGEKLDGLAQAILTGACEGLADQLVIPYQYEDENLVSFLGRAADAARALKASAGVTWSRYHVTGSAEGFLVEETTPDVPERMRARWKYPPGPISLENVAEALAGREQAS